MAVKISLIVPVYNGEKTIEKCINSILNQTYRNIEVIIIDDGSTDNTYEICKNMQNKDNRIQLIKQNNKGPSLARNVGIEYAQGKYIQFVDADDWLEPSIIAECVKFAGG